MSWVRLVCTPAAPPSMTDAMATSFSKAHHAVRQSNDQCGTSESSTTNWELTTNGHGPVDWRAWYPAVPCRIARAVRFWTVLSGERCASTGISATRLVLGNQSPAGRRSLRAIASPKRNVGRVKGIHSSCGPAFLIRVRGNDLVDLRQGASPARYTNRGDPVGRIALAPEIRRRLHVLGRHLGNFFNAVPQSVRARRACRRSG